MRWDGQLTKNDAADRLPGLSGESVVRTFDAPEALDVRFHEIYAKSAINRVPGSSRVPFRWTVNPYRGCTHACTYCASGDTWILMGDGSVRMLADLKVGDVVYGTEVRGDYRRYVRTIVLDHWSSVKPAFRTTLADGTELITSGDHRFLTERGWKYVNGAMAGRSRRPYLTSNNRMLGTGASAEPPTENEEYRRGYLCGMVRGEGTLGRRSYKRQSGSEYVHHSFRLALCDSEALHRTQHFLSLFGVQTKEFAFDAIEGVIDWPLAPSDDWRKGFLAGIFDAEGSCTAGSSALRIPNTDQVLLGWAEACLEHFGFSVLIEDPGKDNGLKVLRMRGGLKEQLRFFHLTNPAISRKREIEGLALKSDADLRVMTVEPLGLAMRLFDITTGTGDFIANGVVSHNCFARPTHEYLDMDAGRDFEREIVVKVNVPEVLRAELARPSWCGEHVALGTNTDPYQWVEKRYGLMRGIWEAFRDFRNPCSVLTKSPLLLRDADLFEQLLEVTEFSACLSIPTLDEKAWRATEPHTPHPRKRIEAVAELNARGIPASVLVAPLMPGINDSPDQMEPLLEACREAGARTIGGQALFLAGSTKGVFMDWLRTARPDLVQRYEVLYAGRSRLAKADREAVEAPLRKTRRPQDREAAARFKERAERVKAQLDDEARRRVLTTPEPQVQASLF